MTRQKRALEMQRKNAAQAAGKNEKKVVKSGEKTVNKATENGKKGLGSTSRKRRKAGRKRVL